MKYLNISMVSIKLLGQSFNSSILTVYLPRAKVNFIGKSCLRIFVKD